MCEEIRKESDLAKAFIAKTFIRADVESGIYIPNEIEMEEFLIEFMEFTVEAASGDLAYLFE